MNANIFRFSSNNLNAYLIVKDNQSLLIDCPSALIHHAIVRCKLPLPNTILHTHVQEEHCLEWVGLPAAEVFVPEGDTDLARCSRKFRSESITIWSSNRSWEKETMGMEPFSVAGRQIERPPKKPVNVCGTLKPGATFTWQGINFDIISLMGHGRHAIGLYLEKSRTLFSGDILAAGGTLINMFDLERGYGISNGYTDLKNSLGSLIELAPAIAYPSTGNAIFNPSEDAQKLLGRIEWRLSPTVRRQTEEANQINYTPLRSFGRFRENIKGIFQSNNMGNVILFIDDNGHGLIIDPDICVWNSWEENCRDMNSDLDMLEKEAGLKTIDYALITHYHGDHIQYCRLLNERYGTKTCATFDVASVMENPEFYNLPASVDWYGFPFDYVPVQYVLTYELPFIWNNTTILPVHTPGHCFAHTGYKLTWEGKRLFCTGDVVQYGTGPISTGLGALYSDIALPERHSITTLEKLRADKPDIVLCGHSRSFIDPDGSIVRDMIDMANKSIEHIKAMITLDYDAPMTPPGLAESRQIIVELLMPADRLNTSPVNDHTV